MIGPSPPSRPASDYFPASTTRVTVPPTSHLINGWEENWKHTEMVSTTSTTCLTFLSFCISSAYVLVWQHGAAHSGHLAAFTTKESVWGKEWSNTSLGIIWSWATYREYRNFWGKKIPNPRSSLRARGMRLKQEGQYDLIYVPELAFHNARHMLHCTLLAKSAYLLYWHNLEIKELFSNSPLYFSCPLPSIHPKWTLDIIFPTWGSLSK